jgi:hypothetical protein
MCGMARIPRGTASIGDGYWSESDGPMSRST